MMGVRGVTVLGASGDGGPHWSFGPFSSRDPIGAALNKVNTAQHINVLRMLSSSHVPL